MGHRHNERYNRPIMSKCDFSADSTLGATNGLGFGDGFPPTGGVVPLLMVGPIISSERNTKAR